MIRSGSIAFSLYSQVAYSSRSWTSFADSWYYRCANLWSLRSGGAFYSAPMATSATQENYRMLLIQCKTIFRSFNCINYSWSGNYFFVLFVRSNSYKVVEVNKLSLSHYITDNLSACMSYKSVAACVGIFFALLFKWNCQKNKDLIGNTTRTPRFQ